MPRRLFFSALSSLMAVGACAGEIKCPNLYYENKTKACVDAQIAEAVANPKPDDRVNGFLAAVFTRALVERRRVLASGSDVPEKQIKEKQIKAIALYRAGLTAEGDEFLEQNPQLGQSGREAKKLPSLDNVASNPRPADNELLIGAYMASGEPKYFRAIVKVFSSTPQSMTKDAIRLALNYEKFGEKSLEYVTLERNACQKYECKSKSEPFEQVVALSKTYLNLLSIVGSDEKAHNLFQKFALSDPAFEIDVDDERRALAQFIVFNFFPQAHSVNGQEDKDHGERQSEIAAYQNFKREDPSNSNGQEDGAKQAQVQKSQAADTATKSPAALDTNKNVDFSIVTKNEPVDGPINAKLESGQSPLTGQGDQLQPNPIASQALSSGENKSAQKLISSSDDKTVKDEKPEVVAQEPARIEQDMTIANPSALATNMAASAPAQAEARPLFDPRYTSYRKNKGLSLSASNTSKSGFSIVNPPREMWGAGTRSQ